MHRYLKMAANAIFARVTVSIVRIVLCTASPQSQMVLVIVTVTREPSMKQRVEIAHDTCAPNESRFDLIRKWVMEGWEPWHMECDANGWREIYFKRPVSAPDKS